MNFLIGHVNMEADTTTFTTGNVVDTSGQSVEDTRDSNGDVGSVSAADTLNPSLPDTSVPAEIQRAHSLESDELNASQSSNEVPDIKQISQSLVDDAPGGGYRCARRLTITVFALWSKH